MTAWWARYVGLPFAECHCWGLVVRVYAEHLGVRLPAYGEISAADLLRVARAMESGKDAECWRAVKSPEAFDVVLMRARTAVCHVGVVTDGRRMLHTERGKDAVHVALRDPLVAGRIVGYRRYTG